MDHRFRQWSWEAATYIRLREDRSAVQKKLEAHLEEKLEKLETAGMQHEAAV